MLRSSFASLLACAAAVVVSSGVAAQPAPAPASPPPSGAQPAPSGYAPPGYPPPGYPPPGYYPPGYYPPPGYPPGYYPPAYSPPGYYPPAYPPPAYPPPASSEPPPFKIDPENPPPGYHTEWRARRGMVVSGAVLLGISYLLSITWAATAVSDHNAELAPLFIPVVGPFMTIASADVFEGHDAAKAIGGAFLIVDGIVQVSGLSLLVIGVAARKAVAVPDPPKSALSLDDVTVGPRGASVRWRF